MPLCVAPTVHLIPQMKMIRILLVPALLVAGGLFCWQSIKTEDLERKQRNEHYQAEAKKADMLLISLDRLIRDGERNGNAPLEVIKEKIDGIAAILNDPTSGVTSADLGQGREKTKVPWLTLYRVRAKGIEAKMAFSELSELSDRSSAYPSEVKHAQELGAFINGTNIELEQAGWPNYVSDKQTVAALIKRVKNPNLPIVRASGAGIE